MQKKTTTFRTVQKFHCQAYSNRKNLRIGSKHIDKIF